MDNPAVAGGRPIHATERAVRVLYVDTASTVPESLRTADEITEIRRADTADEALATLDREHVDCVVSEYALPDSDGVSFLRTVRNRWANLPFVLFTDSGDEGVASEAIGAGATDYLPKDSAGALGARVVTTVTDAAKQQAILGRMTDAFFAVDTDWRFTYVNDRGRELLCEAIGRELSTGELLGRPIWEEIPSAVDTRFYDAYHRAMDEQESVAFEEYFDPTDTWFEVRAYPSPTGLSVYFTDVTERKAREAELTERDRVLREVYQIIADKERALAEKVDELLDLGRAVLGTDCAALSNIEDDDYVFDVVHDPSGGTTSGDVVPLGATNCERAVVDEETLVLADVAAEAPELTDRAGFTEMGIACYIGTPVWVDGEIDGTFCFFDTEPRSDPFSDWEVTLVDLLGNWVSYEQERERREAELTRERNRLDDFASLVSHDLRNPLTVALGRLDIVREGYAGDPDHVDTLEASLERMDALIEDLLVLSRSGHQTVEPEPHRLQTVATAAWEATGSDDATFRTVDGDTAVYGDPVSTQQLFENLLRNSVEHGGSGVLVEVGSLSDGFYVADDGPGIPPEERDRVFDSGYTTSDDGTGFGLRIVREVLDAHGWSITVTESEHGGARFEITGVRVD
ncbi:ATP-binding protein [Haloarcula onubensis]|uniref:histidine kinase n=1 Tax=Haloarcula onubensis TaxID=2950539 RepID=A0ABU2FNJ5_9EURY|nr:ATP-binding protein [Halomicroarcula sp. S3CR25-11]MDS0282330.1 ATP-binding protein [Halomicroarcula sp. S3CR25-11]